MADAPAVSIVVVTYNCRDLVLRCLATLPAALATLPFETIVVDNASADGTLDAIREGFPWVDAVAAGANLGFAAGNNLGLARTRARVIVFLNPDTEPEPGSLARLVRHLDEDAAIGLAGPRLVFPDGSWQPSCRAFPTFGVAVIVLLKLYRLLRFVPAVRRYDMRGMDDRRPQDVEQIMGACMAMPRSVLDRVGGFDERFWMWFEEVDLCRRVRQAGWRVCYRPDAQVMHRMGQSAVLLHSVFAQRMYARSLVAYFEKHGSPLQARVLRALSGFGAACAHVVQGVRRVAQPGGRRYRIGERDAGVGR